MIKRLMLLAAIALFVPALPGCFKDAIHVHTEPGTFEADPDAVHVAENAVHVERGAVDVEPNALHAEKDALHVESGAVKVSPKAVSVEGTMEEGAVTGNLNVRVASKAVNVEKGAVVVKAEKESVVLRVEKDAVVVHIDTAGLVKGLDNGIKEIAYVFVALALVAAGLICWLICRSLKKDKIAADNARITAENQAISARQDMERAIAVLPPDKAKEFLGFLGTRP